VSRAQAVAERENVIGPVEAQIGLEPAFETAATSSGVVKPPAIGACTIG